MSYDFLFFKLCKDIESINDVDENSTTVIGHGQDIKAQLTELFPSISWKLSNGHWWGTYQGSDTWYEFSVDDKETNYFSVKTSLRATTRAEITKVCTAIGVIAVDTQKGTVTGSLKGAAVDLPGG